MALVRFGIFWLMGIYNDPSARPQTVAILGIWENDLGEGSGRGIWERNLGEGSGRWIFERDLGEGSGRGIWARDLGEGSWGEGL